MKKEIILKIMFEKIKRKWVFENTYNYLVLIDDVAKLSVPKIEKSPHVS